MPSIQRIEVPSQSLLHAYGEGSGYADCYCADVGAQVLLEPFVHAFYTTPLFKVERAILRWFASRPSSDADALALAAGTSNSFAAWKVEGRRASELLLADFSGRTRSWLMTQPIVMPDGAKGTRLYFGSAVVPIRNKRSGKQAMGFAFTALLGFHKVYSRLLLRSALSGLEAPTPVVQ